MTMFLSRIGAVLRRTPLRGYAAISGVPERGRFAAERPDFRTFCLVVALAAPRPLAAALGWRFPHRRFRGIRPYDALFGKCPAEAHALAIGSPHPRSERIFRGRNLVWPVSTAD